MVFLLVNERFPVKKMFFLLTKFCFCDIIGAVMRAQLWMCAWQYSRKGKKKVYFLERTIDHMITFGEVVHAFRTGEMSDELKNLDVTVLMGILSGKPYRQIAVYNTAFAKYQHLAKRAACYENADEGDTVPASVAVYQNCTPTERAEMKRAAGRLTSELERCYGGIPVHPSATKLVLCDEAVEQKQDFLMEDLLAAIRGSSASDA